MTVRAAKNALPIDEWLSSICQSFEQHPNLLLVASPGAGKTTRVPPALLAAPWLARDQKILVLQPRRMAARATAARMAQESNSELGDLIGYQVRFENKSNAQTRLLVMTEGVLERRLIQDPELKDVGLVVLDEFHERSIHSDLCVALLRELQESLRPDLKLLIMSATLEAAPLKTFLNDCPLIEVSGRAFPVDIDYQRSGLRPSSTSRDISAAVIQALNVELAQHRPQGDLLVFLPGVGEINRCLDLAVPLLKKFGLEAYPLHGSLAPREQDLILAAPGNRRHRIIFSTNIAETSLTIEGVTCVIDSGLVRLANSDTAFGIEKLELCRISKKSAEQRAGRAGRVRAGRCLRLWTRDEHLQLSESQQPEIARVELSSALLLLSEWGVSHFETFAWFETPPPAKLELALKTLRRLEALDQNNRITALGKKSLRWPLSPRLALFMERSIVRGCPDLALTIAAALSDRPLFGRNFRKEQFGFENHDSDLIFFLLLRENFADPALVPDGIERGAYAQFLRIETQLSKLLTRQQASSNKQAALTLSLIESFSDRIAYRRNGGADARMLGGRGLLLSDTTLCRSSTLFLAIDPFEAREGQKLFSRVDTAHPVNIEDLKLLYPSRVQRRRNVQWNDQLKKVQAFENWYFEELTISEPQPVATSPDEIRQFQGTHLLSSFTDFLKRTPRFAQLLCRARFLKAHDTRFNPTLVDWSLDALKTTLLELHQQGIDFSADENEWLPSLEQLLLGPLALNDLNAQAPHRIEVPSGSVYPIQYPEADTSQPFLSVRLQEIFGWHESPKLAWQRVPLKMELLSPGYKPVQVTTDLKSFWAKTYFEVRKELKAQYPRHSWPEDPLTAIAIAKGGKRRGTP